jgi:DNA primase
MSAAARLLERLDGARATGRDRWQARCPAHEDRSPSLSVRQVDDRVLVHCFAGCGGSDIVAAVGMTLADLFDAPLKHQASSVRDWRRTRRAQDSLKLIAHETLVVKLAAENMARGITLQPEDRERLLEAADVIAGHRAAAA